MIPGSRLILHDAATFVLDVTLSSDTSNFNLRNRAITAGWDQRRPLIANVKINSGIVLSANSTAVYAFDTGTTAYPAGSRLTVDSSSAFVIGMGGGGGRGGAGTGTPPAQNGAAGGPAVRVNLPTVWNNLSGTIGGGGGGGGGGTQNVDKIGSNDGGGGGGGRSGRTNSAGGFSENNSGGSGTFSGPGAGGSGSFSSPQSFAGGNGGGWGAAGAAAPVAGANGGGAGIAIVGNSNITWTNTGTRLGAIT